MTLASPSYLPAWFASDANLESSSTLREGPDPHTARGEVNIPRADVVIEPGGDGSLERLRDESHRGWLQEAAQRDAIGASVCTVARLLAAAGLLHQRPFTTYHDTFASVAALDPKAQPCPGQRWIDDGQVITDAGVSAGIDMALHLVGRPATPERAREVQDGIEYRPAPPTWASRS